MSTTNEEKSTREQFEDIIKEHGFELTSNNKIIGHTPAGIEIVHAFTPYDENFCGSYAAAFERLYEDFDPWREAHRWIDDEGKALQLPENNTFTTDTYGARELVKDYDAYSTKLCDLSIELDKWDRETQIREIRARLAREAREA
jgi:hypothetical protein